MIKVDKLTKQFHNFKAVDNISFSVDKGSVFAFLGPNGAGKSTTIKMLVTLLSPNSGYLSIGGVNVEKEPFKAREMFGVVFQDHSLDEELTAHENMYFHSVIYGLSKKERKEKIDKLLSLVNLEEKRNELVKNFSGGMKRRLEIARGLLHEPEVLFLDEPTLGLDPQTRNYIWGYIKELNEKKGLTVFFTTHYMEEAERYADKIAIIDKGKIVIKGTSENLKKETETDSLEKAFLKLTGYDIRDENISNLERMRNLQKKWKK
ncbi:ATP-binding cassette domain-containing protein [bacterium]|nr:ATP-binding cassette domain-containing protein [bacterium]